MLPKIENICYLDITERWKQNLKVLVMGLLYQPYINLVKSGIKLLLFANQP
jgi:hypothetical protein